MTSVKVALPLGPVTAFDASDLPVASLRLQVAPLIGAAAVWIDSVGPATEPSLPRPHAESPAISGKRRHDGQGLPPARRGAGESMFVRVNVSSCRTTIRPDKIIGSRAPQVPALMKDRELVPIGKLSVSVGSDTGIARTGVFRR